MPISPANLVAQAKATIRECTVSDVQNCLDSDTILIDIRELAEFQRGCVPGAVLLPRGLLEFEISGLLDRLRKDSSVASEDQPIVLYCGIGARSALAAQTLQRMGYTNVQSMAGGIVAWLTAKLPVTSPDAAPHS